MGTEGAGSAPLLLFSCSLLSSALVITPRAVIPALLRYLTQNQSSLSSCCSPRQDSRAWTEIRAVTATNYQNSKKSELPKEHWHLWELWGGDAGPDLLLCVLIASLWSFLSKTPSFSSVLAQASPPLEVQLARGGVGVEDVAVFQQVAALSNHLG